MASFKPQMKMSTLLQHPNTTKENENQVIYEIKCTDCDNSCEYDQ